MFAYNAQGDIIETLGPYSMVILSGNWEMFKNPGFSDSYNEVFAPGIYYYLNHYGMENAIYSLQPTTKPATQFGNGGVPDGIQCITFGAPHYESLISHRHIFLSESDFTVDNIRVDDQVGSFVIPGRNFETGFQFYGDLNYVGEYLPNFGPGIYDNAVARGISDGVKSAKLSTDNDHPDLGAGVAGEVVLFSETQFRGNHKHIFASTPRVMGMIDVALFKKTASMAILGTRSWQFFAEPNYQAPYQKNILAPGFYPDISAVEIPRNTIASLRPVGTLIDFPATATLRVTNGAGPTITSFKQINSRLFFCGETIRFDFLDTIPCSVNLGASTETVLFEPDSMMEGLYEGVVYDMPVHMRLSQTGLPPLIFPASLRLEFGTDDVYTPRKLLHDQGSPPNPVTNHLKLVGGGTIKGGYLDGRDCLLSIEGTLAAKAP